MLIYNQPPNHISYAYSYQAHQFQPINHLTHAYSPNSCFNRVTQSNIWPSTKNKGKNKHTTNSCTILAQAMDPRSGESGLSLKLHALA